jgi:hypothetical protein
MGNLWCFGRDVDDLLGVNTVLQGSLMEDAFHDCQQRRKCRSVRELNGMLVKWYEH